MARLPEFPEALGRQAKPTTIMALASRMPILKEVLYYWEQGHCSWETAMQLAVVLLANRVERLEADAIRHAQEGPATIILERLA